MHNGDDVFLIWHPKAPIVGCRDFAVHRERNGVAEIAQSYAGFANETWEKGEHHPSTVWPIQKYVWTDDIVQTGDTVRYRVIPVVRRAGKLQEAEQAASAWSTPVTLDLQVSKHFACYFNRGIVANVLGAIAHSRANPVSRSKFSNEIKIPGGCLTKSLYLLAAPRRRKVLISRRTAVLTTDRKDSGVLRFLPPKRPQAEH